MTFDVITIFPGFFAGPLDHGVVANARNDGLIEIRLHDLRKWTRDRHKTVDDRPFGGGEGMLLKPEPLFQAVEEIWPDRGRTVDAVSGSRKVVLVSAHGRPFNQETARSWSQLEGLMLICGRYEGVDERVAEHLEDDEVSIGDYVLSGGELAAAVVMDAVARLVPGVVGNRDSTINESFSVLDVEEKLLRGKRAKGSRPLRLLDCPQYTRPAEFRGWQVPEVLLGGNHAEIRKWRLRAALDKTARLRPDLLNEAVLEIVRNPPSGGE